MLSLKSQAKSLGVAKPGFLGDDVACFSSLSFKCKILHLFRPSERSSLVGKLCPLFISSQIRLRRRMHLGICLISFLPAAPMPQNPLRARAFRHCSPLVNGRKWLVQFFAGSPKSGLPTRLGLKRAGRTYAAPTPNVWLSRIADDFSSASDCGISVT